MKKVLLYEPSGTFARFMNYLLVRLGYEVVHVDNAGQIMAAIAAARPDFIIAEAHIKDLSGIELCKLIREEMAQGTIPVAIVSIDGSLAARSDAQQAGCIDYLTKPLTARAIHGLMERHLPFHHKRQSLRANIHVNATIRAGNSIETLATQSISDGGMYACTDNPRKVGTILNIRLHLPGLKSSIELNGRVIYTTNAGDPKLPQGMGIKFTGIDSNTETLLQHYLESYLHGYLPEALFKE